MASGELLPGQIGLGRTLSRISDGLARSAVSHVMGAGYLDHPTPDHVDHHLRVEVADELPGLWLAGRILEEKLRTENHGWSEGQVDLLMPGYYAGLFILYEAMRIDRNPRLPEDFDK